MPRASLRSPSRPRPTPSPGPSPIEVFLGCFLSRGVTELPVPELVCAYLMAFKADRANVRRAWKSLRFFAAKGLLELLPAPRESIDIEDRAYCPSASAAALVAIARLCIPLEEARSLLAIAAAPPFIYLPSSSPEERATAQLPPDVSTPRASPLNAVCTGAPRVGPSGGCSAAAKEPFDPGRGHTQGGVRGPAAHGRRAQQLGRAGAPQGIPGSGGSSAAAAAARHRCYDCGEIVDENGDCACTRDEDERDFCPIGWAA